MSDMFLKIVNMSLSAGWVVLAVLLLRVLLKKAPKWITVLLWGIVAIRLICPFSIESVLSLIPSAETVSPDIMLDPAPSIDTGVPIINEVVNPIIGGSFTPDIGESANPLQIWIPILSIIWVLGMVGMLLYTVVSCFQVKRRIRTAIRLRDNIYQSETVISPFVFGVVKPTIYLPLSMNEREREHVIAHEQAHICRKDHWWKPLGFTLLAVYWFNPLLWLGYVLLCRDIELACDEKVVKAFDDEQKADYSQALLSCSVSRRVIAACPIAFGEVGVKDRVKSVLHYKKPAFWIIVVSVIAGIVTAVCFLTNPITAGEPGLNDKGSQKDEKIKIQIVDEDHLDDYQFHTEYHDTAAPAQDWKVLVEATTDVKNFRFVELDASYELRIGRTLFELEDLKANSPILLHTYINDAVFNRGISYQDDDGIVHYFGLDLDLNDGGISLVEIDAQNNEASFSASNTAYPQLKISVTLDAQKQAATSVTVWDESTNQKIQDWELGENEIFTNRAVFLVDVTFDGEQDLLIPQSRPASAAYFSAYVWDTATKQFVYAPTFETLPNVALDADKKAVLASRSADKITSYSISTFDKNTNDFKMQRSLAFYPNGENMIYEEKHLKNGTMQTVAEFTKPIHNDDYYAMDPELAEYYGNHTEWKLYSARWTNYLIPLYELNDSGNESQVAIEEVFINHMKQVSTMLDMELGTYALYDMNKDGTPELLYWSEFHLVVCVYHDGVVEELETAGFNAMNGPIKILENGAILSKQVSTGVWYCYETLGRDNTITRVYFSSSEFTEPLYEFDNEPVSKDEWDRLTKAYFEIPEAKIEWKEFVK